MDFIVSPASHTELAWDQTCYKHTQHIPGSVPIPFFWAPCHWELRWSYESSFGIVPGWKKIFFKIFLWSSWFKTKCFLGVNHLLTPLLLPPMNRGYLLPLPTKNQEMSIFLNKGSEKGFYCQSNQPQPTEDSHWMNLLKAHSAHTR